MRKVYIAIPYTGMEKSSYKQCVVAVSHLIKNHPNVLFFSPIINSHPLTKYGLGGDWGYWKKVDLEWLALCDTFLGIIPREGMEKAIKSIGLKEEYLFAEENKKEILFAHFDDIINIIL